VIAPEVHHAAPRCLLRLWDEANGSLPETSWAWLEFEHECQRWSVPVEISREDLEELIESSTEILEAHKHRLLHETDFVRWGRRGGLSTLRRYGSDWFSLLALRRWDRISSADLEAARPLR
jgi:hypothetical protein